MSDCGNCRNVKRKNKLLLKLADALDDIRGKVMEDRGNKLVALLLSDEARKEAEK